MTFEKNISRILNINFLQDLLQPTVKQYQLPPQTGDGTCRIIQFGSNAIMVLFDCKSLENYTYFVQDDTLLHISYFKEVHSAHPCTCTDYPLQPDTFYSHIGFCGKSRIEYEKHTPVKGIHIFLSPDYYDTYLSKKIPDSAIHLKKAITTLNQIDYFPEFSLILDQLYNYQETSISSLLFYESKLTEILALILQKSSDCRKSLTRHIKQADIIAARQIAEYISTHSTQEISLTFLARMAYMSPAKLKYVFKSVFHCSIRDYRIQKRMHVAKEFLYHTDLPISNIAKQLGYQTSGNFSAIFKKHTGFSPKDFRVFSRTCSYKNFSSQ